MIKKFLRAFLESLGYSVQRIAPPPSEPVRAIPCPPLRPVRVELFPGLPVEVDLSDAMPRQVLLNAAQYESPCPQLLRAFCASPDSVFFDIGANFGYYSYFMLKHAPQVTVHSFEPNPTHVRRQRAVAAELAPGRYFPHQLGLGERDGELTLTVSSIDSGWSTLGANPDFVGLESSLTTHRVAVTRFDAWRAAQNLALPAAPAWVVKMDIEGFEPSALRGMEEALRARAFKALVIEVLDHTLKFCGGSAADVFTLMDQAGYAPFDIWLQPTERQPHEARNVLFLPKA